MSDQEAPLRVLIAGGGIAALETLIGLHKLAAERVELHLLSPKPTLQYRPATVTEPFDPQPAPRFDLQAIADRLGAKLHRGALTEVDLASSAVTTADGGMLPFDVLVVAVGAKPREALPGALTFRGSSDAPALRDMLDELKSGVIRRVTFALPGGVSWSLPLYELALLTARDAAGHDLRDIQLTFVSPEESPLALFGAQASQAIADLLYEHGIHWIHGYPAAVDDRGRLVLVPEAHIDADRVVALPSAEGPRIKGLPHNNDGFLEVNLHGRVWGAGNIYAAGDATAFPIKQGGLATQQADAAAQAIAAFAGAPVRALPFNPTLRGKLLTGSTPQFMRHVISGGHGETSEINHSPLWWPPAKIAARYASTFLNEQTPLAVEADGDTAIDVEVELAVDHGRPDAPEPARRKAGGWKVH